MNFLRVLSRLPAEIIGLESFRSLMRIAKSRETENLLNGDQQILCLILNQVESWSTEVQEIFLNEIMTLLQDPKNMRSFFEASNFASFLSYCISRGSLASNNLYHMFTT